MSATGGGGLGAEVLRRLLTLPLVLLGISLVVFLLLELVPGDPALAILGPHATPERLDALREALGLGRPAPARFGSWLGRALGGDLGRSYTLGLPVTEVLAQRLGPTLLLAGAAFSIASVFGLFTGTLAAARAGSAQDRLLTLVSLVGISVPGFFLALVMMFGLSVVRPWFPVSGMYSAYGAWSGGLADLLHHLALPALALGLTAGGVIARLSRTSLLEALGQPYIASLRARGLSERAVLHRHAFKAALASVLPVMGLQAGFVLGGAVYVETVFAWPGLGRALVEAILARDLLLVQGGVLVLATAYVLVNLAADLVQRALDPRTGRTES